MYLGNLRNSLVLGLVGSLVVGCFFEKADDGDPGRPTVEDEGGGGAKATTVRTDAAGAAGAAPTAPTTRTLPGICDTQTWDEGRTYTVKCNPGEKRPSFCGNAGLKGTRTCGADGTYYERAICPSWGTALNQEADFLIVTRWNIANAPGFDELLWATGGMGNHTVAVVNAEDLAYAFPTASVPESIRAGLQFLKANDLPNLKFAMFVGKTNPTTRNTLPAYFSYGWDLPLWYVPTPPHTDYGDAANETHIPTLAPYAYLAGPWSDIADQFWTPEAFTPDLAVGYLPATGAVTDKATGRTDLQVYAAKLNAWSKTAPFKASQFHASQCVGEHWYDMADLNAARQGVTETIVSHNCANGESGDAGALATADGSKYMFYAWHGWDGGSGNYDAVKKTGYTMATYGLKYDGIQFAYSCSTARPDWDGVILGENLLFTPGSPIAYVGYDRTLIGDLLEPMAQAFVAGRWTLGEAVDGFRKDIARDLVNRVEAKALMSLLLYGNPALVLAPPPSKAVKVLATRTRADGDTDACVQVQLPGDVESDLFIGSRKLTAGKVAGWRNLAVTLKRGEVDGKQLLHLDACDPAKETCQAGQADVQRDLPLHCGALAKQADGSYDLEVTAVMGQNGPNEESLVFRVAAVTLACADGVRSDCFADAWPWARSSVKVADVPVAKVLQGQNRINFRLAAPMKDGERFRALRVTLDRPDSSPVGTCYVPMSEADAIDYELL